ncbi:Amidase like protein [Verticillium longisporum]|nr:Amidase like protein [Verticillium longisporum]
MSVFFKDIASDNPVREGDVEKVLAPLGLTTKAEESSEYERLLAAVHDCAERVLSLPDYQPAPDLLRYPRQNVRLAVEVDQKFGHAWAHRFLIKGSTLGGSMKGKSVCLKDCIAVAGVPQFFGSDAFPAWTPSTDATIVTRVLDEGLFAGTVGTRRVLKLFTKYNIKSTWFIPGHSLETFPEEMAAGRWWQALVYYLNCLMIALAAFLTIGGTYGVVQNIIDAYASGEIGGAFSCADNSDSS